MSFKNIIFNLTCNECNDFCDKCSLLRKLYPFMEVRICETCQNLPEKCETCKEDRFCSVHECEEDCIRFEQDCYCEYCDNVCVSSECTHSKCETCKLLMKEFKEKNEKRISYVNNFSKNQETKQTKKPLKAFLPLQP